LSPKLGEGIRRNISRQIFGEMARFLLPGGGSVCCCRRAHSLMREAQQLGDVGRAIHRAQLATAQTLAAAMVVAIRAGDGRDRNPMDSSWFEVNCGQPAE